MANNVSVKCVGVCRNVKIVVCGIKAGVDMYVLLAKEEGYPIILGRLWLIAMNARQNWEKETLVLKPQGKGDKPGQVIVYNMKEGKQESLELETSEDESRRTPHPPPPKVLVVTSRVRVSVIAH